MLIKGRLLIRPDVFFVVCAVIFGLLIIRITPPMQTYDEQAHFYRAYQLSDFNLRPDRVTVYDSGLGHTRDAVGGELPDNIAAFGNNFLFDVRDITRSSPAASKQRALANDYKQFKSSKIDYRIKVPVEFPNTGLYSPVTYIPQTIAVWIGKVFNLNILTFFYLGRVLTLAFWIGLTLLAIRWLPIGKWFLVAIALLPVSLFQASTWSADGPTNALLFLTVALFLKNMFDNKTLDRKAMLSIGAASLGLSVCKSGFWPLVLIFWLLPKKAFSSRRNYFLFNATLSVLCAGLALAWTASVKYVMPYFRLILPGTTSVDYQQQTHFVAHHPVHFAHIVISQFTDLTNLTYYYRNATGILGWGETPLSKWGFWLIALILVTSVIILMYESGREISKYIRLSVSFVWLLLLGLLTLTLYLTATPVHDPKVYGFQGRYFIPYFALLIPILGGALYRTKDLSRRLVRWAPVLAVPMATLLIITVTTLYARYYGTYIPLP